MKKTQFLEELRKSLIDRGYSKAVVENELTSVSAYFDEEKLDEIEIPVSEMADEISALISEQPEVSETSETQNSDDENKEEFGGFAHFELDSDGEKKPEAPVNDSQENKQESVKLDDVSENAETDFPLASEDGGEKLESPVAVFRAKENQMPVKEQNEAPQNSDNLNFDDDDEVKTYEHKKSGGLFGKKPERKNNAEPAPAQKPDKELEEFSYAEFDEEKVKSPAFTVLLIFALPFIAFLSLVAVAVYLGFWLMLALILIAVVAFLIAFVAVGVTVTLVGIVYGAIMMIKGNVPVGLFEIGLGITVGAAVLFFGILIYNFAIRLIPFAMKMLAKLLGFAFIKVKEGLKAVKKMLVRAERGQNE
ncbi:MAG: hypothetical protein MJ137_02030 [Clostridia bacterium]|nr:hypothetical protein [Clostridia bacterium]